ncbi:hypothetical protein GCM10010255_82620 [Streptomyces coeruleofuscus]|uniref:Uncharacterized protein n=1 Tax=Streptomyces coeruleofuscus TaxID=66879 RepID=A0ABP5WHJ6_9ACTN
MGRAGGRTVQVPVAQQLLGGAVGAVWSSRAFAIRTFSRPRVNRRNWVICWNAASRAWASREGVRSLDDLQAQERGRADDQCPQELPAIATRFDKCAYVFHGTVTAVSFRLWLRS